MTATDTGRTRRPQLNETITHLNDITEGLGTAVPEVVADAVRQALGGDFAAALGRAVADALAPTVRHLVRAEVAAVRAELDTVRSAVDAVRAERPVCRPEPMPPTEGRPSAPVRPPEPPTPSLAARVLGRLSGAKAWIGRRIDALVGAVAVAGTLLRLLGVALAQSPAAALAAGATALAFGVLAAVTDPAVGVFLAALSAGTLTAVGGTVAPLARLADPDDGR